MPEDKQSKKTADGDFSNNQSSGNGENSPLNANQKGDIASKALDLPISTSHSPQTDNNNQISGDNREGDKKSDKESEIELPEDHKPSITDYFYKDKSLGLSKSEAEIGR